MFGIFSTQDTYIIESRAVANDVPGKRANYMSSIEDAKMKTVEIINSHGQYVPTSE